MADKDSKYAKNATKASNNNTAEKEKEEKEPTEPRIHSDWIKDYVRFTSGFQESPELYHRWMAIAAIAGALDRDVYIRRTSKNLYPNLYILLVSPTGLSKKTACADIAVDSFLKKVDKVRIVRDKITPKGLLSYMDLAKSKRDPSSNETYRHCTALYYMGELSDSLKEQSYTSGLIELLTALWDCRDPYEDNTKQYIAKKEDSFRIPKTCLNIIGCSNPEWLANGFKEDAFGGGMMGRIICVWSEDTNKTEGSAWMEVTDEELAAMEQTLLSDLQKISELRGAFKIEPDAKKYYADLYLNYGGSFSGRMAGFLNRKLTYALKLAMILSVNENSNLILEKRHIVQALEYLAEVEEVMPNAFVYINTTREAKTAQRILAYLKDCGGAQWYTEIVKQFHGAIRNIYELEQILNVLVTAGILRTKYADKDDPGNENLAYIFSEVYDLRKKAEAEKKAKEEKDKEEKDKDKEEKEEKEE